MSADADRLLIDYYERSVGRRGVRPDQAEELIELRLQRKRGIGTADQLDRELGLAGKRLLDVGGGTGEIAEICAGRGADVFVIDPDAEAVRVAQAILGSDHAAVGVAERLPAGDDSYDIVVCHNVLEHVESIHGAILELKRVTRPGGHILVSVPNYLFPYEGHYRMKWLPVPKRLGAVYLRRRGRDPSLLLHETNYTTYPGMALRWRRHGLHARNLTRERVRAGDHPNPVYRSRVWRPLALYAGLFPNVTWLLTKPG